MANNENKQIPFVADFISKMKAFDQKICLHPLASPPVCNKIISAHTIQRSKILKQLIDPFNHVLTFYKTTDGLPKLVGWRLASTFNGFCGFHDSSTFEPIENQPFNNTLQQCFLIGYRALCHEVYQKTAAVRAIPDLFPTLRPGINVSPEKISEREHIHTFMDEGMKKGLNEFLKIKSKMDNQLVNNQIKGWSRVVINFSGELCIASTGLVSVTRDFDGKELQNLQDIDVDQQTLLFGIIYDNNEGAFVMIWPDNQKAPRSFAHSLLSRDNAQIPGLLVQFMLHFVENTYFSPKWWDSRSSHEQVILTKLALDTNQYYSNLKYISSNLVPWKITNISID